MPIPVFLDLIVTPLGAGLVGYLVFRHQGRKFGYSPIMAVAMAICMTVGLFAIKFVAHQ